MDQLLLLIPPTLGWIAAFSIPIWLVVLRKARTVPELILTIWALLNNLVIALAYLVPNIQRPVLLPFISVVVGMQFALGVIYLNKR